MIRTIDVSPGQKWRVHRPFKVLRGAIRYRVSAGSTLVVKSIADEGGAFWVTDGYNRFTVSQDHIKEYAQPA